MNIWIWAKINSLQEYLVTFWLLIWMVPLIPLHLTPHLLPSSHPASYNWLFPNLLQLIGSFCLIWLLVWCCCWLVPFISPHVGFPFAAVHVDWSCSSCHILSPKLLSLTGSSFFAAFQFHRFCRWLVLVFSLHKGVSFAVTVLNSFSNLVCCWLVILFKSHFGSGFVTVDWF